MATGLHKLSDRKIRAASKPGRLSDGGSLFLRVRNANSKSWAFVYRRGDKWTEIGLGGFPAVTLASAREKARAMREALAEGFNPRSVIESVSGSEPTFAECVDQFLGEFEHQWRNAKHRAQWRSTLTTYCRPFAGNPVSQIAVADVLSVLGPIWQVKPETASRLRGRIERVLDFAKVKGWRSGENPALWRGNLKNALPARQKRQRGHHPAMPYERVPEFVGRLREAEAMAARALEFLILTAARSGEVLGARWDEIDFGKRVWTTPATRMKAAKEHRVPLSERALAILNPLSEARISDYVFPGQRPNRPLSIMAMAMLMRRMKVGEFTVHGFRSAFRDWCGEETDFRREDVEAALAHQVGNEVERAYRRGDAFAKRRVIMDAWADFIGAAN